MEYSKRDKIKKILKYVAIIAGVLLVLILGLLFLQAHRNAGAKGQPYSIKKFIIDFGASIRGKQISDPSIFDGGLFPIFGLNGDGNLPINGSGTNGGTIIDTDGTGNGTGTDGTNGNGTGTDGSTGTDGQGGNDTGTDGTGNGNGTGSGTDSTQTPQCSDRVDNDADGAVDMDDPDCTDPSDYFESTYNWDTGGDGFYNYDNGSYGPIDFGDFGFDPNYNFDDGLIDTTAPQQCIPKQYLFTDDQQKQLDAYIREFYRIAPNIRTAADVQAEHGAAESYDSLIATSTRLFNQCVAERETTPNNPFWNNDPTTNSNFIFTGNRGFLTGLKNYMPKSDPAIPTSTTTFFPPDTKSLPKMNADDLIAMEKNIGVNLPEIMTKWGWPGANYEEKLRNAACLLQAGVTCNWQDTMFQMVYGADQNGGKYGIESRLYTRAEIEAKIGYSMDYTLHKTNCDQDPGASDGVHRYASLHVINSCGDGNFWTASPSPLNGYIGSNTTDGSGPNEIGELNLGACYMELLDKYPYFGLDLENNNSNYPGAISISRPVFYGLVKSCDAAYDTVNMYRENFEAIFDIN